MGAILNQNIEMVKLLLSHPNIDVNILYILYIFLMKKFLNLFF